jgi:hypothetical protein
MKKTRLISRYEYAGTLVGHIRTPLHAILLWGNWSKSLLVFIDSGPKHSFMNATLVSELGIPTQTLSIPMHVRALDERSIGRVTHNKIPINLQVSGNHRKSMQFLLIESFIYFILPLFN